MKMKKYNIFRFKSLIILSVLFMGFALNSCEDIVELDPYEQVAEAIAFTTPDLIELSVVGMYNAAQIGYAMRGTGGMLRGYPFGSAFVQQGDCRGEDAVSLQTFYQSTYTGNYGTTTESNVWYWSDTYRAINRANIIIEGVQNAGTNGVITTEEAARYEAEARLLRAALYHELLLHFAYPYKHTEDASHQGVPIHTKAFTTVGNIEEGLVTGRSSVADVYALILSDLNYAEQNLPTRSGWTDTYKISRGTKGAAIAYKVRVYQHMYDWNNVITEGTKFISGSLAGEYELYSEPWTTWETAYESTELIYGMQNSATNNPGVNAALASQYKRRQLVAISPIVWRNSFWLSDDKRRQDPEMVLVRTGTAGVVTGIFTQKYQDIVTNSDPSPMMRYAEVLLNIAEAYARRNAGGDSSLGLDLLNDIRDRALTNPETQAYKAADFADNLALLKAILAERRIELAMEGRRWPDIHRLQDCPYFPINGIPAKVANADPIPEGYYSLGSEFGELTGDEYGVDAIPYDNFKFLWPIPQDETNANPTLADQQNPGW